MTVVVITCLVIKYCLNTLNLYFWSLWSNWELIYHPPGLGALQRNRTKSVSVHTHTNVYKDIYYKELGHTSMEAENSQVLQPISWRRR